VVDTGGGIPQSRSIAFSSRFTLQRKATGLGLMIVQRIIQATAGESSWKATLVAARPSVCLRAAIERPLARIAATLRRKVVPLPTWLSSSILPPVGLDDALHDHQSQAGAFLLGSVKRLENAD